MRALAPVPPMALVAVVALLALAGIPAFAGFAHTAYHVLTTEPRALNGHEHDATGRHVADATVVTAHAHTSAGELHTHAAVVDRAIALSGAVGETEMGPPPSQQVDRYAPPTADALAAVLTSAFLDFDAPLELSSRLTAAPLAPPPRG